ncbi:MAG TPA: GTP-binding protein [Rhodopila sp.]|nr:GTP-binding protein [Rhodopila sp.]
MIRAAEPRTPVTVIAGPGKAVLLEHLARDPALARSVVLTAGRAGLVADQPPGGEAPVRLGCVCCTVQGDLRRSLRALLPRARRGDVAQVLVDAEATPDPTSVLTTLITDPVLSAVYRIGGVIAVVGAPQATDAQRQGSARPGYLPEIGGRSHSRPSVTVDGLSLDGDGPIEPGHDGVRRVRGVRDLGGDPATRRLLMLADRVVTLGAETVPAIQGLNLAAQIIVGLPDASVVLEQDRFTSVTAATDAVVAVTLPDPVDLPVVMRRLEESALHPSSMLGVQRLFGLLHAIGESRPVAIDAVRHHLASPWLLPAWPAGYTPRSHLVFMGSQLDAASIRRAVTQC